MVRARRSRTCKVLQTHHPGPAEVGRRARASNRPHRRHPGPTVPPARKPKQAQPTGAAVLLSCAAPAWRPRRLTARRPREPPGFGREGRGCGGEERAGLPAASLAPRSPGGRSPPPHTPRGLTASTACCRMDVSLENILSRDCSSFSRDDLESSSMRRRRPCCGCPGRSRVKAGAGGELRTEAEREARRRWGRGEHGGRLRGHSAGTRDPKELGGGGGGGGVSGHGGRRLGLFRQRCPPRPAGGAGAARGSRGLRCLRRWTWGGARRGGGGGEGGAGAVHRVLLARVFR